MFQNILLYSLFFLSMLLCKRLSLSPSFKEVFLQNLFATPDVFLSLLSSTQLLLHLSSFFTHLYRFVQFLSFHKLQGNLCESIHKSTTNRYTSIGLIFSYILQIKMNDFNIIIILSHVFKHSFKSKILRCSLNKVNI